MNNILLTVIIILVMMSVVLFAFYYRDIVKPQADDVEHVCEPFDLVISDITMNSLRVEWRTDEDCLGLVKYGSSVNSLNLMALSEGSNIAQSHTVRLENLEPASTYYLIIFSGDQDYGQEGSPIVVTTSSF